MEREMSTISLIFEKMASAKTRTETLRDFSQLKGVKKAELVFGDSTDSTLNRIATVDLHKSADAAAVLKEIQSCVFVEKAYIYQGRHPL
jgi:hypothetical protein